jgi:hypothetical protein
VSVLACLVGSAGDFFVFHFGGAGANLGRAATPYSLGPFTLMRSMSEYELPADCPLCQASAPRVTLTAPYCSRVSPQTRLAQAASERSAEPILAGREARQRESVRFRRFAGDRASRAGRLGHTVVGRRTLTCEPYLRTRGRALAADA